MKTSREIEQAVIERIATHSGALREALASLRSEWEPGQPPPYIVMAEYAEIIAQDGTQRSTLESILTDIERYIAEDGPAADIAAVGFLEALLSRAVAGRFDLKRIANLLGPRSLDFCVAWDKHTGCKTVTDPDFGISE